MKLIAAFFKLVRLPNLFFIALTQVLLQYCIYQPLYKGNIPNNDTLHFVFLVLASLLIAAAGYIINDYFDINECLEYFRDNFDDEEDFLLLGLDFDDFDPDLIDKEQLMLLFNNNSMLAFEAILNGDTLSASRSIGTLAHEYACHIKAHGDNLL